MIIMIDNYDSFTYNLVQYLGQLGEQVLVRRNDETTPSEITGLRPSAIVISPGPCTPREAGITVEIIRHFYTSLPILGVCLGHQAIGYAFGAHIVKAARLMHGKTSDIFHDGETVFRGLPNPFKAGRYHSLIIDRTTLPDEFAVTAHTAEGEIMGIRHRTHPVEGIQFHPESILTPQGKRMLKNFLDHVRGRS